MAYGYSTEENDLFSSPPSAFDEARRREEEQEDRIPLEGEEGTPSYNSGLPPGMVLDKPTYTPQGLPEGMTLDEPEQLQPQEYPVSYSGYLYPTIAQQRSRFVSEIDNNPKLRDFTAAVLSQEAVDPDAQLGVIESLFNRADMRKTSIARELTNGFYGPVKSGAVDRILRQGVEPWMYEQFDKAYGAVRNGSDLIEGRTDQGMEDEINGPKRMYGKEWFGYMYGDPTWSLQHQRNKGEPGPASSAPGKAPQDRTRLPEGMVLDTDQGLPPGMILDDEQPKTPASPAMPLQQGLPPGMTLDEPGEQGQAAAAPVQAQEPPSETIETPEKPLLKLTPQVALKLGMERWIDQDTGMEVRRATLAGTPEESLPISSAIHKPKAGEPSLGINPQLKEPIPEPTPDVVLDKEGNYVPEWQRPLAKSPLRTGQNEWIDAANSFARGASSDGGMLSMFEGLYDIVRKTTKDIPALKGIHDNASKERDAVSAMRDRVQKRLPVDKDFAENYAGQIASGLGQLTNLPIYVGASAVGGPLAAGAAGAVITVGQLWQEAKDDYKQTMKQQAKPYNEAEADKAATQYVAVAAPLETLADYTIVGKFLKSAVAKKLTVGQVLKEGAKTFTSEGTTEGLQQAWNNYVANTGTKYDPKRPMSQGVVDSFIVGGVVGHVGGTVATLVDHMRKVEPFKPEVPGAKEPKVKAPILSATATQVTQTANGRLNTLRETRDGTPPQVTSMDADGRPVYGEAGKAGRTLLKHEEEELAFLEKNIDNPEAIANEYNIKLKEEPKEEAKPTEAAVAPEIQKKQDRIAEIDKQIDKEFDPEKKAALVNEAIGLATEVDKAQKAAPTVPTTPAEPKAAEPAAKGAPIEPTVETTSKPGRIVHKDGKRGEVVSEKDDTLDIEWDDETTSTVKADEVRRSTSTTVKQKNTVSITSFGKRGMSVDHYDNEGKKVAQEQWTRGTPEESYEDAKAKAEQIVKENNLAGYYDHDGSFVRVGEQPKAKGEETTVIEPEAAPGEWQGPEAQPGEQGLPLHMQEAFLKAQAKKAAAEEKALAKIEKATGIKGLVNKAIAAVTGKPTKTTRQIYREQINKADGLGLDQPKNGEAWFKNTGLHEKIEAALKNLGVPIKYVTSDENEGAPAAVDSGPDRPDPYLSMDIAASVWVPMIETARATGGEKAANRVFDRLLTEEVMHAADHKAANEAYDALPQNEKNKYEYRGRLYSKRPGRYQYKRERYSNIVKEAKRIAQAAPAKDGRAIAQLLKNSFNTYQVYYNEDYDGARGYNGKPEGIFDYLIDPRVDLVNDWGWSGIQEFLRQAKQFQLSNDLTEATHAHLYDKIGKLFRNIINGLKRGLKNIIGTGQLPLVDQALAEMDKVLAGDASVNKQSSVQSIQYGTKEFTDHVGATTVTIGPDGKHQALYAIGPPALMDGLGFRFEPEKKARRRADNATASGQHVGYAPMPVWVRAEKPAMVDLRRITQQQGQQGWNPNSVATELLRNAYISMEDLHRLSLSNPKLTNASLKQLLQNKGFDSIAFKHSDGTATVIVFEQEQAASATGNDGVYSIDNLVHTKDPNADAFETEIVRLHNANGGSSYNAAFGDMVGKDFYSVGSYPELSISVKGKEILRQDIIDIRDRAMAQGIDLNVKHVVIGTWYNPQTGWTDIDISAMVPDFRAALEIAEQHQQTAIFDLATMEAIFTNGAMGPLGLPSISERNGFIAAKAAKPIEFLHDEDALTVIAKENEQYKDWYARFAKYMRDVFLKDYPEYIPVINYLLASTSPAQLVAGNFTRMVRALRNFVETGDPGVDLGELKAHQYNLRRTVKLHPKTGKPVEEFENLSGLKVTEYTPALFGDPTAMAIDRHVAMILFGTNKPTDAQREEAMRMIMRIAKRLKWSYAEVQTAFFAADLINGGEPVDHYERTAELRKTEVYKLLDADRKAGGLLAKISASLLERTRKRVGAERLLGDNTRAKQQILRAREVAINEYVASAISLRGPPQKAGAKGVRPEIEANERRPDPLQEPRESPWFDAERARQGTPYPTKADALRKQKREDQVQNLSKVKAKAPTSAAPAPATGQDIRIPGIRNLQWFYQGIKHILWNSPGLAGLGNMVHKHIDLRAKLAAEYLYPIAKWMGDIKVAGVDISRPAIKKALNEHQEWRKNKGASLPTPSLSPKAKELKNLIDGLIANINNRNAAAGIKIKNPAGNSVPIPNIEYPAILQQKYLDAMREPHNHQTEWNELVDALKAEHIIPATADDAMARNHIEKFLNAYDSNGAFGSFFFFNKMIPSMAHDYSLGGMQEFIQAWVDKVSLAEAFGPNPNNDLFEFAINKATSKDVKDFLRRVKNLAYGDTVNNLAGRISSAVGGWASIQHLANWATATKDLVSGQIFNVNALGLRNYITGFWNSVARPFQSINDAREQGILLGDLMRIMTDGERIGGIREQVGATAMSLSFRNLVETWNRGIAFQGGKSLLRHAIYAYNKNPRSSKTLQYMAHLRKLGFRDGREELILQEGGKGELAAEYLRAQVNAIQAGYTYADVPAFVSEPAGKFFLKYSPWSVEHMRFFISNVLVQSGRGIGLAPKDKVTVIDPATGKKETRVVPRRPLDAGKLAWYLFLTSAGGAGEEWLLEQFFRMRAKTARWSEIFDRFKRDDPRAWNELGTKLWQTNMLTGTFGYLGNLIQHGLVFAGLQEGRGNDKGILGVVQNMPSLDPIRKLYDSISMMWEQKAVTGKSLMDLTNAVSGIRVASQAASNVANDVFGADYWLSKTISNRQDISRIRNMQDRWMADMGKEKAAKMIGFERMEKTEEAVWREPLHEALSIGDLAWAKQIVADVRKGMTPQRWEIESKELKASIKAKQPIKGSEVAHVKFTKWVRQTQTPYDVELVRRVDDTYRRTATQLGLGIEFKPPSLKDMMEFDQNIKLKQQPTSYSWSPFKF